MKRQIFTAAAIITVLGLSACQVQKETETVTQEQNEMGSAAQVQNETGVAAQAQTGAGAAGHGVLTSRCSWNMPGNSPSQRTVMAAVS